MNKAEQVREIWAEMKELKILRDRGQTDDRCQDLEIKYSEIDALFGRESTLLKAIVYYLNLDAK